MKKVIRVFLVVVCLIVVIFGGREFYIRKTTVHIALIYTSDIHGYILPEKHYDGKTGETFETGGAGSLVTYLPEIEVPYLLLDAGDIFMGAPEGALAKGEMIVKIMNKLNYRASACGNHELDYGLPHFEKLSLSADFPFLCCNLFLRDGSQIPSVSPFAVFEAAGIKVGVIGVIEEDLDRVLLAETAAQFTVTSASGTVQKFVDEISGKCDVIVVLSGLGLENDKLLARYVRGIDVIAGGETHIALQEAVTIGKTMICEPGWGLQYAGRIDLRVGKKGVARKKWSLVKLLTSVYPPTDIVQKILPLYETPEYRELNEVIGFASSWILRRAGNSPDVPLGNLITDIMRDSAKTDFAFQNLFGIRDDIAPGAVRARALSAVSPFGNTIVKMLLTGAQVREVLRQSATGEKGYLQLSGLKMVLNSRLPSDKRLLNVIVGGKEIDDEAEYSVATNNFVAGGGDGFKAFLEGKEIKDTLIKLRDAEIDYFKANSPVKAEVEGRIVDVNLD
ncbi:MAG: bifunctional UDP-sugar hydrolase/5'-nucleotidase [bacterium]